MEEDHLDLSRKFLREELNDHNNEIIIKSRASSTSGSTRKEDFFKFKGSPASKISIIIHIFINNYLLFIELLLDDERSYPIKIIIFNVIIGQLLAMLSVGSRYIGSHLQNDLKLVTPLCFTMSYYLLLFLFNISLTR